MTSKVQIAYDSSSSNDEIEDEVSDVDIDQSQTSLNTDSPAEKKTKSTTPKKMGPDAVMDVMSKILGKGPQEKHSIILSKGVTDKALLKRKVKKEKGKLESDDSGDESELEVIQYAAARQRRRLWENMGRSKPDVLDKDKEKQLQRIATRGVVQLFNAVRKQQKLVEEKLQVAGSEGRKEKVLQTMTKGKFMDVLKGSAAANVTAEPVPKKTKTKNTSQDDNTIKQEKDDPSWSILREDFMMGAKMKDWDKASDSGNSEDHNAGDLEDSDMDT